MRPLYLSAARTGRSPRRALGTVAVVAALGAGLVACDGGKQAAPAPSKASAPVAVADAWVKTADEGMSAAFGTLRNTTGAELTIVSATSPVSAMELHEVVVDGGKMVMRPKAAGFTIPAGGAHQLRPGGDHLMLMGLKSPVRAGDQVSFTLRLKDGRSVAFTAPAKPFAGANENYVPHGGKAKSHG